VSRRKSTLADVNVVKNRDVDSKYEEIKIVADNIDDIVEAAKGLSASLKYLGASTTPPSQRRDNAPIQDGDYYLDSNNNYLVYYNMSGNSWAAIDIVSAINSASDSASNANSALSYKNDAFNYKNDAFTYRNDAFTYRGDALTYKNEALTYKGDSFIYSESSKSYRDSALNYKNLAADWAEKADNTDVDGIGTRSAKHYSNISAANAAITNSDVITTNNNVTATETNKNTALTYSNNALTYSNNASTFADNALASANNASTSETNTSTLASAAATSESNASASKNLAQMYANHPEDSLIPGTTEYSAYHWKQKAAAIAGGTAVDSLKLGGQLPSYYATSVQGSKADTALQPLDNISQLTNDAGYTGNMTGAEVKTAYEAELNTNAFTDAEKALLANQSGVNTGDQVSSDFVHNDLSGVSLKEHLDWTVGTGYKIDASNLPSIAITNTSVVSSEAAQLAISAQSGDIAIRTDLNNTFIHNGGVSGTIADWTKILSPLSAVSSVAGKVGAVVLNKSDVGLSSVDNTADLDKPVSTATNTALALKVDKTITVNGKALSSNVAITASDVGLGSVNNTSDINKPISTATANALALKADKSQVLTDVPAGAVFTDTVYTHPATHDWSILTNVPVYASRWATPSEVGAIPQTNSYITGDLNTYKTNGFYRVNNTATNAPTADFYALVILGNEADVITQIASHYQSGDTYVRSFNTAWSSWNRLDNKELLTGSNTYSGNNTWNGNSVWSNTAAHTFNVPTSQTISTTPNTNAGLVAIQNGGSGDAFMTFHIVGDYAVRFGLDGATNKLSVGGWSMGQVTYALYHEGNKPTATDVGLSSLSQTPTKQLKVITSYGEMTIGPDNVNWCHLYTDRAKFYFNAPVHIVTGVYVYGTNTYLEEFIGKINNQPISNREYLTNPSTRTLVRQAIFTEIDYWTGTATLTLNESSYLVGDVVEVNRLYSTVGNITVVTDQGAFYVDGTSQGNTVTMNTGKFKARFKKIDIYNWIVEVTPI